jgi:transcriptional regulator with XRE-family HTH domain
MGKTIPPILPRIARLLEGFGLSLKLARLRRKYSSETVAQRAGITRRTLSKVEQGDPGVALGIYARVMQVLRLENDLAQLAVDDVLGRKLQDAGLTARRRAPKRTSTKSTEERPAENTPSIRNYINPTAHEPGPLKAIGEEAQRNRTNALTSRQIDQIIKSTRVQKNAR